MERVQLMLRTEQIKLFANQDNMDIDNLKKYSDVKFASKDLLSH